MVLLMRSHCCACRDEHNRKEATDEDEVDSQGAPHLCMPLWGDFFPTVQPASDPDVPSDSSTSDDDSESSSSSSETSVEKTPSVKAKRQHVKRAKVIERMFADIEEGGCQDSVSSG